MNKDQFPWPIDADLGDFTKYVHESEVWVSRQKCLYLIERCKLAEAKVNELLGRL